MPWQLLSLGVLFPAVEGPAQKGPAQRPVFLQSLLFENSGVHENVVFYSLSPLAGLGCELVDHVDRQALGHAYCYAFESPCWMVCGVS